MENHEWPPSLEQFDQSMRLGWGSRVWMIAAEHVIDHDLLRPIGDLDFQAYLPMAFPKLPFELASIGFGDVDAALKFVTQWGLLGFPNNRLRGGLKLENVMHPLQADGTPLFKNGLSSFDGEPLEFIWLHARQIRTVLHLAKAVQDQDVDALAEAQANMRSDANPTCRYYQVIPRDYMWFYLVGYSRGGITLHQDGPQAALSIIGSVLSRNLKGIEIGVESRGSAEMGLSGLGRTIRWDALIQVIYWHLFNHIVEGGHPLAICRECGSYYVRTDARQQFCPATELDRSEAKIGLRNRAQSQCALRFRMKKLKRGE